MTEGGEAGGDFAAVANYEAESRFDTVFQRYAARPPRVRRALLKGL